MRILLLAAVFAVATCRHGDPTGPGPTPPPVPWPVPDEGDDAAPPAQPSDTCETLFAKLDSNECAPPEGHELWLQRCANIPSDQVACALSKDACGEAFACLEPKK